MNKDTAKDYMPFVQALAEGKTIQHCKVSGEAGTDVVDGDPQCDIIAYRIVK